jgi:hypothetical protein
LVKCCKCEKNIGCKGKPNKEHSPETAFEDVIVLKQMFPGMMHSEPTEDALKGNSKHEPDKAD